MVNSSPSQENVTDNTCEKYNMPTGNAGREASQQTEVLADQTDHYSHSKNHAACVQNKISGDDMAYKMVQALESKMTTMCKLFVDEKEHRPVDTNDNYITKSMAMGSSSLNARQTMTEILEEVRDQFREHSNTLTAMDLEAMIGKLEVTGYGKNMENFELLRGVMKDDTKSIHDRIAQAEKIVVQEIQMKQPEMPTSHVCETLSGGSEDDVDQSHERASHQNDAALKIIELAIEIGDSELLKRLPEKIEIKVWLNKPDNKTAVEMDDIDIVKLLLEHGADSNLKNPVTGLLPLDCAISSSMSEVLEGNQKKSTGPL
ncbi:uncharacterized protein [Ptychodera flava]|uniref:uncharacterized protein n=1 Tax=Ptychodera flava TaxID=63121 RepID=UPI00396A33C4